MTSSIHRENAIGEYVNITYDIPDLESSNLWEAIYSSDGFPTELENIVRVFGMTETQNTMLNISYFDGFRCGYNNADEYFQCDAATRDGFVVVELYSEKN
ncbi:MAG: hypothetical protein ACRDAX_03940 [Propionibacteriaceae bacterium]